MSGSRRSPASRPPSGSLRNYATDPTTKAYVDNLDIFILPSVNPDGGHYSFYDRGVQRKNLTNYCGVGTASGDVGNRGNWGVDLNRNNTVGYALRRLRRRGTNCTSETFAGPSEASEPEIKNEHWVVDTFPKIKFAINIHTHGGYFMWAPGAYKSQGRDDAAGAEHRHREVLLRRRRRRSCRTSAPRATR